MSFLHPKARQPFLTTAEILYHMPDFPALLQSFIWQDYDYVPNFPKLSQFLKFWENSLEGKIHSVAVAHTPIDYTREINYVPFTWTLQ